jgi:hypothetical protein
MEKILVDTEIRRQLRETFKVSEPTLISALKGTTASMLAIRIRNRAIELGGAVKGTEKVKIL